MSRCVAHGIGGWGMSGALVLAMALSLPACRARKEGAAGKTTPEAGLSGARSAVPSESRKPAPVPMPSVAEIKKGLPPGYAESQQLRVIQRKIVAAAKDLAATEAAARKRNPELQTLFDEVARKEDAYRACLFAIPEIERLQVQSVDNHADSRTNRDTARIMDVDGRLMDAELAARQNDAEVGRRYQELTDARGAYEAAISKEPDVHIRRWQIADWRNRAEKARGAREKAVEQVILNGG